MKQSVFFKLPTAPAEKASIVGTITEVLKGNYWSDMSGALFSPKGLDGVVPGMGYKIGYSHSRSEPERSSPQIVTCKHQTPSNFPGMLKGGLPEFLEFTALGLERKKPDESMPILEVLDVARHFVNQGHTGWLYLSRDEFYCSIIFHDWSYKNGLQGLGFANAVIREQEGVGTYPARIVVRWPDSYRNEYRSTEADGMITRPIVNALRKLGLEEYQLEPISA